jgi:hypothetical protein
MFGHRTIHSVLAVGILGLGLSSIAHAGTHDPQVNARQEHQQQRIQHGVQNGSLTPNETRKLEAREHHINQTEQHFKADGNLSKAERAKLNKMENHASKAIYSQKHDEQARH